MPRNITITFEDGSSHVYQGAPDDVTPDQVEARASKEFGKKVTALDGGRGASAQAAPADEPFAAKLGRQVLNVGAGALRGAGSIGATILTPYDMLAGNTKSIGNPERRQAMDDALSSMGADTKSLAYGAGKIGAEVAGTLGAGGALANGAARLPSVAAAAPNLLNAIRTSGMTAGTPAAGNAIAQLGNLGTRAAGGAITGGASAALLDPDSAGTGAMIGGALPVLTKSAGAVGQWLGSTQAGQAVAGAFKSGGEKGATAAIRALGMQGREAELMGYLRGGSSELVPGSKPTVAQALVGTPAENAAGVYERVVSKSPGGNRLLDTYSVQGEARKNALEAVAPTNALGLQQAKTDLGTTLERTMIPEEKAISKTVSRQYAGIDPNGAESINLPVKEMQAAVDKYMGRGTFGNNTEASKAVGIAKGIAKPAAAEEAPQILNAQGMPFKAAEPPVPTPATWDEVGNLRASINSAMRDAKLAGDKQALGALTAQKNAIDTAINTDLSPTAKAAWLEANASHAAKMDRFHTGPQVGMFRMGSDGLPAKQSGEIAGAFWGAHPALDTDVKAFRKLTEDNPAMLGQFKSMITTEGLSTQTKTAQELSAKFPRWVDQHITGLREALEPAELESIQRIAQDIQRSLKAGVAGKGPGATSDTYQLGANAINGGFLDSTAAKAVAHKIPFGQAARGWGAERVGMSRARNAADFMSDADSAQNMLQALSQATGKSPNALQRLLENSDLAQLGYRVTPALAAGR